MSRLLEEGFCGFGNSCETHTHRTTMEVGRDRGPCDLKYDRDGGLGGDFSMPERNSRAAFG